ncbi:MAG: CPBP family intramembrane metalloprotease [Ardenticatenaceae bacterium]|nr:CPBP family intramembrane metalloprotease [Anaerolineales bacterium]MCB8978524.1 CPBP family intramembrane metalloprotease [Ardenticatenaceae bacterium]
MKESFLDQVELGQTEWYRTFFGIILILFFWLILGSVFVVVPMLWVMMDSSSDTAVNMQTGMLVGVDPIVNYVALNLSFGMMIVGVFVTVRFVHGRPFRSIITPAKKFEWQRMWQGFGLWLLLVALASGVEYLFTPEIYTVVFNARRFLPFALVVLLLTPMQTTAEELLFRGYLLQTTGQLGRNFIGLSLANGILFMIPHLGNPELAASAILLPLFYLSIGAFFAYITLRDNSAALAIGAHASNNLYSALFANYTGSALQTESIFLVTKLNAVYGLVSFWVMAVIFYLILLWRREKVATAVGNTIDDGI